jgi:hypothetical protein
MDRRGMFTTVRGNVAEEDEYARNKPFVNPTKV